jgi:hypothetical protein
MRIDTKRAGSQAILLIKCVLLFYLGAIAAGCGGKKNEVAVIPPVTHPLSRRIVGFGVVNVSYTHVNALPRDDSASQGYLRRGSMATIVERRTIKNGEKFETWVLVEGSGGASAGWLRETLVDIYDNEGRAKTASESLSR